MAKKEHVEFVRTDDFEAVSEDLAQAMEQLDAANGRIQELLEGETIPLLTGTGEEGDDFAGEDEMDAASEATQEGPAETS